MTNLDSEMIDAQRDLLLAHRKTLGINLEQLAKVGSHNANSGLIHGIRDARKEILRIKEYLRSRGMAVENEPIDETSPIEETIAADMAKARSSSRPDGVVLSDSRNATTGDISDSTVTIDQRTNTIITYLGRHPLILYAVLLLSIIGLLSILWGTASVVGVTRSVMSSSSPQQPVVGTWKVESILYNYGPGQVSQEYWVFKEDGSWLVEGTVGHYTLLEGGKKIQLGTSDAGGSTSLVADMVIEGRNMTLKNITYSSIARGSVYEAKEIVLSKI